MDGNGKASSVVAQMGAENARLKAENASLRHENEMLGWATYHASKSLDSLQTAYRERRERQRLAEERAAPPTITDVPDPACSYGG